MICSLTHLLENLVGKLFDYSFVCRVLKVIKIVCALITYLSVRRSVDLCQAALNSS